MQATSRRPTARNLAAEVSGSFTTPIQASATQYVSIDRFEPNAEALEPNSDVRFRTTLSNNTSQDRWVQVIVLLDGVAVATDHTTLAAGDQDIIGLTRSYSDLTVDRAPGDYPLAVKVKVGSFGTEVHNQTWGTFTLVDPNDDSGGDGGLDTRPCPDGYSWSPSARQCIPDDSGDPEPSGIPRQYLLAGGGAFFGLAFLLVLL